MGAWSEVRVLHHALASDRHTGKLEFQLTPKRHPLASVGSDVDEYSLDAIQFDIDTDRRGVLRQHEFDIVARHAAQHGHQVAHDAVEIDRPGRSRLRPAINIELSQKAGRTRNVVQERLALLSHWAVANCREPRIAIPTRILEHLVACRGDLRCQSPNGLHAL